MKKTILATVVFFAFLLCGCRPETDVTVLPQTSAFSEMAEDAERITVLINKNSNKYHTDPDCAYALRMSQENRLVIEVPDFDYLEEHGYDPCSGCQKEQNNKDK